MRGSFDPKERDRWIPQGEKLLRVLLANSNMLPIGEDLGTVPSDVRDCLQRLVRVHSAERFFYLFSKYIIIRAFRAPKSFGGNDNGDLRKKASRSSRTNNTMQTA